MLTYETKLADYFNIGLKMDSKDRQILRALQRNGRITNQDLASKVNLSPSPCLRRLRILEKKGVIRGYNADVDAKIYGLPVMVFIRIQLNPHTKEIVSNFESKIRLLEEVLECHLMTGSADYLLRVLVEGLDSYENFIRRNIHPIGGIASIDSSFVYGTIKTTNVFPAIE